MSNQKSAEKGRIDWMVTLVPFILIVGLAMYLFIFPEQANGVIGQVRFFLGDTVGVYYLIIGIGVLLVSVFLSVFPLSFTSNATASRKKSTRVPTIFPFFDFAFISNLLQPFVLFYYMKPVQKV